MKGTQGPQATVPPFSSLAFLLAFLDLSRIWSFPKPVFPKLSKGQDLTGETQNAG